VKFSYRNLDLRLRRVFRIATGELVVSPNVLVQVQHQGHVGLGEAHPVPYVGEDREAIRRALAAVGGSLDADPNAIEAALDSLPPVTRQCYAARAAIDMALHDLAGKLAGQPAWKRFGIEQAKCPVSSYTIGLDNLENVPQRVREADGFPVLKVKLGTEQDRAVLEAVRAASDKPLRADANTAWTVEEAIAKLREFRHYDLQFVEQPIPPGDPDGLRRIREAVDVPIFADESSCHPEDVEPLAGAVDGINIKLMKCGGLAAGRRMIDAARSLGLQVMIGCFIESSAAITAAAHLSPLADFADLDGNVLIANDPFQGVTLDRDGRLVLPDGPGLGITPRPPAGESAPES
jgi:L-alanine-DL-glutamate epimerase-like enolase superfamily enzyme